MVAVEPRFPSMKEGYWPARGGAGRGAEAGGSILDQPVNSIPASRPLPLLARDVEAEPRPEPRGETAKPLRCCARHWRI